MSFLFGHHHKSVKPDYTGLAVQTSNSAIPIAIGLGMNRAAPNIVWQGDFQAHKQTQKTGKGFGGSTVTGYTYSGSYVLSLGWGPAATITQTWKDQSKTAGYSSLGFTFIAGNIPQAPWGFLTTNHASQALGYAGLVLMCVPNLDLGQSNTLPQFSFEVQWPLYNTAPGGKGDADPAQCVDYLLNSNVYGALIGFPMPTDLLMSTAAATTTGDDAFQTYCKAMGFGMSPLLDSQEGCLDVLTRWTTLFNADLGWTGYSIAFIARGADTVTGNGVTYLPDNTLEFALTDANGDFIYQDGEEPVRLRRTRRSQLPNYGYLEIKNRSNDYNTEPAPWDDQGLIDEFGPNSGDSFTAHEICEPSIGVICANLYGQRLAYTPNQFEFTTGPGFMAMVPGSKGTITDPKFGTQTVRVVDLEEQDDGSFSVVVEEWAASLGRASTATPESTSNTPVNTEVAAAAVNPPIIFEPPSTLAGSAAQVWMAVSAGPAGAFDPNWGGCYVWLSSDGATYQEVGTIDSAARMGLLTSTLAAYGGANPDTVDSFGVNLSESNGSLTGVTAADAAANVTLCVIQHASGVLEFLSFRDATLTGANQYTLGGQLYRGLYGTTAGSHSSGVSFARLDDNIFKLDLPSQYIGKTLYVKLQSFNIFGGGVEDLSTCTAYTYTPLGTGFGGGSGGVPTTPATPSAAVGTGYNLLSWTANPASDNVDHYSVYRAAGTGGSFGSATLIGNSSGTTYTDATAVAGAGYTYFLTATNAIGTSANSAGVNVTSGASSAVVRFYGSVDARKPDAGEELFNIEMKGDESFASGFPDNLGSADVAATADAVFAIYKNGSSVGTMKFAAGAAVATWTLASGLTFAAGDRFKMVAPAVQDTTLSGISYTFSGRRG